ncbi:hypothetical protein PSD17_52160 [Pseudonocardia sp. D17]|nr:hypothetical protein PSD17_52160 [Pseudonocardia sp. D17]
MPAGAGPTPEGIATGACDEDGAPFGDRAHHSPTATSTTTTPTAANNRHRGRGALGGEGGMGWVSSTRGGVGGGEEVILGPSSSYLHLASRGLADGKKVHDVRPNGPQQRSARTVATAHPPPEWLRTVHPRAWRHSSGDHW